MKYRGKEYKWFNILFEDNNPVMVELFKNCPWEYFRDNGKITTGWENDKLTEKPIIK